MIESNPPLLHHYGTLVRNPSNLVQVDQQRHIGGLVPAEECQLPLIDLHGLKSPDTRESLECSRAICRASSEWGFFQVLNHGISPELLQSMRREQLKLFAAPFERKATCGLLNNSYRWGTPTATRPTQYSWSEAFHIPVTKISEEACYGEDFGSLSIANAIQVN
ncbi:gibberellin 2-beta-dioxygenase 8 [Prunus yedoensis var. nudiflora]|uniref:Gibberellin 2-beta-dioxygenase 8 n=1 Tax=Prunus yedoensis var. nudiflora TaxID=2094558 RepID=A0A314U7Q0_PRUYE|nr:gibberellin 2-beta-dioxygenase 8 [Prunus yedoensis var. nudiflora]